MRQGASPGHSQHNGALPRAPALLNEHEFVGREEVVCAALGCGAVLIRILIWRLGTAVVEAGARAGAGAGAGADAAAGGVAEIARSDVEEDAHDVAEEAALRVLQEQGHARVMEGVGEVGEVVGQAVGADGRVMSMGVEEEGFEVLGGESFVGIGEFVGFGGVGEPGEELFEGTLGVVWVDYAGCVCAVRDEDGGGDRVVGLEEVAG